MSEKTAKTAADIGHVNQNGPERAPRYVLLPGDPDRVTAMAAQWDEDARVWTLARQAKCAAGTYKGAAIGA